MNAHFFCCGGFQLRRFERYHVTRSGTWSFILGDKKTILTENESITIPPGNIHWAKGKETWFYVYSTPGWTPEDHILVMKNQEISRKEFDKKK